MVFSHHRIVSRRWRDEKKKSAFALCSLDAVVAADPESVVRADWRCSATVGNFQPIRLCCCCCRSDTVMGSSLHRAPCCVLQLLGPSDLPCLNPFSLVSSSALVENRDYSVALGRITHSHNLNYPRSERFSFPWWFLAALTWLLFFNLHLYGSFASVHFQIFNLNKGFYSYCMSSNRLKNDA